MTKKCWLIFVGKKEYRLTDSQYQFMKNENMKKGTTMFWFEKFSISLPHVSSMEPVYEQIDEYPTLPEQSPLEREEARKRIAEIKEDFLKRNELLTPKIDPREEVRRRELLMEQGRALANK